MMMNGEGREKSVIFVVNVKKNFIRLMTIGGKFLMIGWKANDN